MVLDLTFLSGYWIALCGGMLLYVCFHVDYCKMRNTSFQIDCPTIMSECSEVICTEH